MSASTDASGGRAAVSRLERWLASPWRRLLLALGCILALSALSTNLAFTEGGGGAPLWSETFLRNFVTLALWGLLFEPMFWSVRFFARHIPSWWLQLLVHVPLYLLVLAGMSKLHAAAFQALDLTQPEPPPARPAGDGRTRSAPPPFDAARANARRDPPPPDGPVAGPRRPPGTLFAYWALLALAWGIDGFLRGRADERRSAALALRASGLERDLVAAQLSNLRNQLHPHFLFNALHSVGGLIRQGKGELAVDSLAALGSMLRSMLDQERRPLVPLCEELELVERYLAIESQRLGERLDVTTSLDADVARVPVPALLLLPLVENAVRHAVAPRPAGGRIAIEARRAGEELVLEVRDDGPGFPPEVLEAGHGSSAERAPIGLANTASRLRALYGGAAGLELANAASGSGASVRVRLPLVPPVSGGTP